MLRALSRNQSNSNSNSRKRKRRRKRNFHDTAAVAAAADSGTDTDRGRYTDADAGTDPDTDKAAVATAGTDAPRPRPRPKPHDDSVPNKFSTGTDDDDGGQGVLPSWPTARNRNVSGYITPEDDLDLLPHSAHSHAHSRSNSLAARYVCNLSPQLCIYAYTPFLGTKQTL